MEQTSERELADKYPFRCCWSKCSAEGTICDGRVDTEAQQIFARQGLGRVNPGDERRLNELREICFERQRQALSEQRQ